MDAEEEAEGEADEEDIDLGKNRCKNIAYIAYHYFRT